MFSLLTQSPAIKKLLRRWRVPNDFPYYADWHGTLQAKTGDPQKFRRQILQMYGENPDTTAINFEDLIRAHPEFIHNPLAAYKHRYDNGYAGAPAPDKKIIFLHLQRTAGSTFTHLLRRNVRNIAFRRDFVGMPNESPIFSLRRFRELNAEDQERERDKWDLYDAFGDHSIYGMHEMLRSPYTYVTILRDPVDRLVSYYRYIQRERSKAYPEELKEAELARSLSIIDFIYHPLFRLKLSLEQSYMQTLSGYTHPGGYVLTIRTNELMHMAKAHLDSFGAVLLQERFSESAQLMCKKFGWKDELYVGDEIIAREQQIIGDQTKSANAKDQLSPQEYEQVSSYLAKDIELYEYGKQLFAQQLAKYDMGPASNSRSYTPLHPVDYSVPSEPMLHTENYPTSIGPVTIALEWSRYAQKKGWNPKTIDEVAHHVYYDLNLRQEAFLKKCASILKNDVHVFRLWLLTLHAQNVCHNVIEEDAYGLWPLKQKGYEPKIIVDIGAHIGTFSLMAHQLWPDARIYSVEPCSAENTETNDIHTLLWNLRDISQVTVCHTAVFGLIHEPYLHECRAELKRDNVCHWMELGIRAYPHYQTDVELRGIRAQSIGAFLREQGLEHIDLLKLSCEGAETNIVRELAQEGYLEDIKEIRGEWHGNMGKEQLPVVLRNSHHVSASSIEPARTRGYFAASRTTEPVANAYRHKRLPHFFTPAIHKKNGEHYNGMTAFGTSMGPLYIRAGWQQLLNHVDAQEFDKAARTLYYKENLRGWEFVDAMLKRYAVPRQAVRHWLEFLHDKHVCANVIDQDAYGLDNLYQNNFRPKTILDVGGHIGTFSLHARALWPEARIITVEASTKETDEFPTNEILQENIRNDAHISLVQAALIGAPSVSNAVLLEELETDTFSHELEKNIRKNWAEGKVQQRCILSVGDLLTQYNLQEIDLLKLDCEGSETNIVRELAELEIIPRIGAIRGEWHGEHAKRVLSEMLEITHEVSIKSPEEPRGLFEADRKR